MHDYAVKLHTLNLLVLRFLFLCNMVIRALTVFAHCLHWVTVWFRTCNINYCFSMQGIQRPVKIMQQYTSMIVTGGALAIKENFFFAIALEKTSKL